MAGWQFILHDLAGEVLGELTQAGNRQVSLPHMRIPTASFTVPLDSPLAENLMNQSTVLEVIRTGSTNVRRRAFHGPVVSVEEVGSDVGQMISVNAAGPMWRLSKRLVPATKLQAGAVFGNVDGSSNLGQVAFAILNNVNGNYTGIQPGTNTATSQGWVGRWWLKNAAEAIAEVCSGLNTFEYEVAPIETTSSAFSTPTIGTMNIAPTIGQSQPDVIFEYGGSGRPNVASYNRNINRETQLNRAIISVQGWPDGVEKVLDGAGVPTTTDKFSLIEVADSASENLYGTLEEVVPDAGVFSNEVRTQMAQYHVNVRKSPRQQITFTLAPNATPEPFTNYNVGDTVRARAVVGTSTRFDALFRVWGITFNVDDNNNEVVELSLVST